VVAHREPLEALQIRGQVPRQLALMTDHTATIHGHDQG
jgi:hypothetical protein